MPRRSRAARHVTTSSRQAATRQKSSRRETHTKIQNGARSRAKASRRQREPEIQGRTPPKKKDRGKKPSASRRRESQPSTPQGLPQSRSDRVGIAKRLPQRPHRRPPRRSSRTHP